MARVLEKRLKEAFGNHKFEHKIPLKGHCGGKVDQITRVPDEDKERAVGGHGHLHVYSFFNVPVVRLQLLLEKRVRI